MSLRYNGLYGHPLFDGAYPFYGHPLAGLPLGHVAGAAPVAAAAPVATPVGPAIVQDFVLPAETLAEIDARVNSVATATSRAPIVKKETIPIEGPLGRVMNIVKRLPTPAPDVVERTTVIKPHKDHVHVTIERPITPPTVVTHQQVVEDPGLPVVNHQVVAVPPSARCFSPIRAVSPVAVTASAVNRLAASPTSLLSHYGYQSFF